MPRRVRSTEALDALINPHPFILHNPNSPHYCLITLDSCVAHTLVQSSNYAWICAPIHSDLEWRDLWSRREMPGLRVHVRDYRVIDRLQPCGLRVDGYTSVENPTIKGWAWRVLIVMPDSWEDAGKPPSYEDAILGP